MNRRTFITTSKLARLGRVISLGVVVLVPGSLANGRLLSAARVPQATPFTGPNSMKIGTPSHLTPARARSGDNTASIQLSNYSAGAYALYTISFTLWTNLPESPNPSYLIFTGPSGTSFYGSWDGGITYTDFTNPQYDGIALVLGNGCGGNQCHLQPNGGQAGDSVQFTFYGTNAPAVTSGTNVQIVADPEGGSLNTANYPLTTPQAVSGVSYSLSSTAAGGYSLYTVNLTLSSTGTFTTGSWITVVGPAGTQFRGSWDGGLTYTDFTHPEYNGLNLVLGNGCGGNQCHIMPTGGVAGDQVQVTFTGINTTISGTPDTLSVATSSDTVPTSASDYTLTPAQSVSNVDLSVSPGLPGSTGTWTVSFTLSGTGDLIDVTPGKWGGPGSWITVSGPPDAQLHGSWNGGLSYTDLTHPQYSGIVLDLSDGCGGNECHILPNGGAPGDRVQVTFTGTNGSADYASVSTSSDVNPVQVHYYPDCKPTISSGGPKVVYLVANGINAGNPGGSFAPLNTAGTGWSAGNTGYCFGARGSDGMPPSLKSLADYFGRQSKDGARLTDLMGAQGAVILPFGYNGGAGLTGPSADPVWNINAFNQSVPGSLDPRAAAQIMGDEISSIHALWKSAKIVVVGHSEGGLVSMFWWYFRASAHQGLLGVSKVVSLDSPIGGAANADLCDPYSWKPIELTKAVALLCNAFNLSLPVSSIYQALWNQTYGNRSPIIDLDGANTFQAVGDSSDMVYQLLDWPKDGRFSQYPFDEHQVGYGVESSCTPATGGGVWDIDYIRASHFAVINCASTLALFSGLASSTAHMARRAITPTNPPFLSTNVSAPGQSVEVVGSDLGSSAGEVDFTTAAGKTTEAAITNWSNTGASVVIPSDASSGPVALIRSNGLPSIVGSITVLGASNGVTDLTAKQLGAAPLEGQPARVSVTATAGAGKPAKGVLITVSDGLSVVSQRSNANGTAMFSLVAGDLSHGYIVASGAANAPFTVHWRPIPQVTLSASASQTSPRAGSSDLLTAKLITKSGHPLANVPVYFRGAGSSHVSIRQTTAKTNKGGIATARLTDSKAEVVYVDISAPTYGADVSLRLKIRAHP